MSFLFPVPSFPSSRVEKSVQNQDGNSKRRERVRLAPWQPNVYVLITGMLRNVEVVHSRERKMSVLYADDEKRKKACTTYCQRPTAVMANNKKSIAELGNNVTGEYAHIQRVKDTPSDPVQDSQSSCRHSTASAL